MRRRTLLVSSLVVGGAIAAVAVGQGGFLRTYNTGPAIYDSSIAIQGMIFQMQSRSQAVENVLREQIDKVNELRKEVEAEKEKSAKLEKRVRTLELTQDRKSK